MAIPGRTSGNRAIVIDIHDDPRFAAQHGWDEIVAAERAPIFYRSAYLNAYHDSPLADLDRFAYLVASDGQSGVPVAVVPVALHRDPDPLGGLRRIHPGIEDSTALLSHVWHCYDARLVGATGRSDVVTAVLRALRDLARSWQARWYGLVNVERDSPTAHALTAAGLPGQHLVNRYTTDLRTVVHFEEYLARLAPRARANLRRNDRRAADAGLEVTTGPAASADLAEIAALCGRTAARFGATGFYPAETFSRFVHALGPAVHVLQIRQRDRLVAAGVCLTDERRFHTWTCGVDYDVSGNASPYGLLFTESVRMAIRLGRPVLEGGRGNDAFKLRHGLAPRPLDAYVMPV